MQYFNVKKNIRINGSLFIPAVSYPLPASWEKGVSSLQDSGTAHITDHSVTFQNGKPVHKEDLESELKVFGAR